MAGISNFVTSCLLPCTQAASEKGSTLKWNKGSKVFSFGTDPFSEEGQTISIVTSLESVPIISYDTFPKILIGQSTTKYKMYLKYWRNGKKKCTPIFRSCLTWVCIICSDLVLIVFFSVFLALQLSRLGKKELVCVQFMCLFVLHVMVCVSFLFLWRQGLSETCDCGTSWIFSFYLYLINI